MLTKPGAGSDTRWVGVQPGEGAPGQLLQGRSRYLIDWHYGIGLRNQDNVTDADRRVYTSWYDDPDAIRASNGWYQAVHQDIADMKTYAKVTMPLLGLIAATSRPVVREHTAADRDGHPRHHHRGQGTATGCAKKTRSWSRSP